MGTRCLSAATDCGCMKSCRRWSLQKGFVPLPKSNHAERQRTNLDVFRWVVLSINHVTHFMLTRFWCLVEPKVGNQK